MHAWVGILAGATMVLGVAAPASAQDYPTRPITMIVPYAAGSTVDLIARTMQNKMAEALGQPVVVDNRVGAGGITGVDEVARAEPDGYTIVLSGTGPLVLNPLLATVPFDPIEAFEYINLSVTLPGIISINPKLPAKTLPEFVEMARAEPGRYTFSSGGVGSPTHIVGEVIQQLEGIELVHVPYPGAPQAAAAVVSGEVDISFASPTSVVLPLGESGDLILVAQTGETRLAAAPDIPTTAEIGMPGVTAPVWFGYLAPAGTPQEIVDKLDAAASAALKDPQVVQVMDHAGISVLNQNGAAFKELHRNDLEIWRAHFDEMNLKLE